MLNIVDDVTRECLRAVVDTSISGRRVVRELAELIAERGKPKMIVSDNGTELTSNAVFACSGDARIEWHYIAPGKPTQNGFVESFNGRTATSCSTRRCSSPSARPARSWGAGPTTTIPSGRTRRSATLPRPRSLPGSNSNHARQSRPVSSCRWMKDWGYVSSPLDDAGNRCSPAEGSDRTLTDLRRARKTPVAGAPGVVL